MAEIARREKAENAARPQGRETMSTVLDHLDELDLLVRAARSKGIQPENLGGGL